MNAWHFSSMWESSVFLRDLVQLMAVTAVCKEDKEQRYLGQRVPPFCHCNSPKPTRILLQGYHPDICLINVLFASRCAFRKEHTKKGYAFSSAGKL
jgi:hypothetical protein